MNYYDDFMTEEQFQAFRAWAIEGSTIGQRMSVGDNPIEIPPEWESWKPVAQNMLDDFPQTLADFHKWVQDEIDRISD